MGLIDHQESMKVRQQFARGFWDYHNNNHNIKHSKIITSTTAADSATSDQYYEPSLSLGCKRLRPLIPKLPGRSANLVVVDRPITALDLKSFIRPDSGPRKLSPSSSVEKKDSPQVETHPGGTRWIPTQEQIGILEKLYKEGMRTPNAQQIEQITMQLSKYGKIEGKNVFYWFQNHKARERQKQKRNNLGLGHSPRTPPATSNITPSITLSFDKGEVGKQEKFACKRKCGRWSFECLAEENFEKITSLSSPRQIDRCHEDESDMKTLELFPLHPEGR